MKLAVVTESKFKEQTVTNGAEREVAVYLKNCKLVQIY